MKILFLSVLVSCGAWADYEPGTLEALGYLNNEWVEKPRQRAHERELMRIKSQGQGYGAGAYNGNVGLNDPVCVNQPVYGHGGIIMGYRQQCY